MSVQIHVLDVLKIQLQIFRKYKTLYVGVRTFAKFQKQPKNSKIRISRQWNF